MEERTAEEVATIFNAAGYSVAVINGDRETAHPLEVDIDAWWKKRLDKNVRHLELIKAYKKLDGTTSIWTNEDFTAIDAAITSGKAKISAL